MLLGELAMEIPRHQKQSRTGFTLLELMIVILIVGILASLTAAGILKFLKLGPSTKNSNEIRQLESAVAEFHRSFNLGKEYFPSRLKLCTLGSGYDLTQQLDVDS